MRTHALLFLLTLAMPVSAAEVRRVTTVADAYPALSPDGSRLIFQSNRSGTWQFYVSKADGSELRPLATFDFAVAGPSWSPDGTRIMFNSARTTPDPSADWSRQWHEIFSMKPDGTDLRQHTRCRTVCTYGAFSPDMKSIAYRKVLDGPAFQWNLTLGMRNSEVFVAGVDGRNERNLSNGAAFDGWPAWSPDGTRIAFASNRGGPANVGQIYRAGGVGVRERRADHGAVTQRRIHRTVCPSSGIGNSADTVQRSPDLRITRSLRLRSCVAVGTRTSAGRRSQPDGVRVQTSS